MPASTPAYQGLHNVDDLYIREAIRVAPRYGAKVASAISRTIRCIHGLARLHRTIDRDELEVYLGRATETTLTQRWRAHAKARDHQWGVVLFTCDHDRVEALEDVAVRVLQKLHERNALCVGNANVWKGSGGAPPRREDALVYMTWKSGDQIGWRKPSREEIRAVAVGVRAETRFDIATRQIDAGLETLKRVTEYDPLHWWTA